MQAVIVSTFLLLVALTAGVYSACTQYPLISGSSYKVSDSYLTASSQYGGAGSHGPARSRLNTKDSNGKAGAWCAIPRSTNQYIQVDLGRYAVINAVATQGRNLRLSEWVTSYYLLYSDGRGFKTYTEDGKVKTFSGNSNQDSIRKHTLKEPVYARYLRINPRSWNNWICMRWEVYGCVFSGCTSSSQARISKVSNCQLSASTEYPSNYGLATYSRLNSANSGYGGWCPYPSGYDEWIQVDFKQPVLVSRIASQGRYRSSTSYTYRVTKFYVLYSEDGYTWETYKTSLSGSPYTFGIDSYSNYVYYQSLSYPFVARFVRVNPKSWRSYPCLRWEVYGCPL